MANICLDRNAIYILYVKKSSILTIENAYPASILRKSISGRHRPVSYPDGPMTPDIDLRRMLTGYVYINNIYRTLLRNIEMSHMSLCPNQHFDDTHVTGIYMYKPEPYFSFCIMAALNDLFKRPYTYSFSTNEENLPLIAYCSKWMTLICKIYSLVMSMWSWSKVKVTKT